MLLHINEVKKTAIHPTSSWQGEVLLFRGEEASV